MFIPHGMAGNLSGEILHSDISIALTMLVEVPIRVFDAILDFHKSRE